MRWTEEDLQAFQSRNKQPSKIKATSSPSKNKYGNRKVTIGDEEFDSLKEADRWQRLRLLERAGQIKDLKHHVIFRIEIAGMLVCKYEADFTYEEAGALKVEDVKSEITRKHPVYRLKRKLMKAVHNIEIVEV